MASKYEQGIVRRSFVSANNLVGQEGYAIAYDGSLTANNSQVAFGVIRRGAPANQASEIITQGTCMGYVYLPANNALAVGDKLSSSANGTFEKAGASTYVRAVAREAVSASANASTNYVMIELL